MEKLKAFQCRNVMCSNYWGTKDALRPYDHLCNDCKEKLGMNKIIEATVNLDVKHAAIPGFLRPKDPINPDYYKVGGIEQIEYNRSRMTREQFEGWLLGDLMNYIGRYNHKFTGAEQVVDLKKAQWYLIELIKLKEAQLNE